MRSRSLTARAWELGLLCVVEMGARVAFFMLKIQLSPLSVGECLSVFSLLEFCPDYLSQLIFFVEKQDHPVVHFYFAVNQ